MKNIILALLGFLLFFFLMYLLKDHQANIISKELKISKKAAWALIIK